MKTFYLTQRPMMLIMRALPGGCVWQAYTVRNQTERDIIFNNSQFNAFFVETQPEGYVEETTPGWRETPEWKECLRLYEAGELNWQKKTSPTTR